MHIHLHLKFAIRCFQLVGFWPLGLKTNFLIQIIYNLYTVLNILFYATFLTSQLIEASINGKSLEEASALMSIFLFHSICLFRVIIMKTKIIPTLIKKIEIVEENILKSGYGEVRKIYMEFVQKNHFSNKIVIYLAFSCCVNYSIVPLVIDLLNDEPLTYIAGRDPKRPIFMTF